MGELANLFKRLFKAKPRNTNTREETTKSIAQDVPKHDISSGNSSKYQESNSRIDNGRVYTEQENVQYILPKDFEELDRLHQQHWMLKIAFQGNYKAPIEEGLKNGITVLDSGCGPGTWTLEMAETYPKSIFHGADMAPVFPEQIKPQNCEFRLGNLNETLPYPDNYFDYVHQRLLVAGLTAEGWKNALKELFRVLKPGGWIELKEMQLALYDLGPASEYLNNTMQRLFEAKGLLPNVARDLEQLLKNNGFEAVNVTKLTVPINHSSTLGTLHWTDLRDGTNSLRPVLMKVDPVAYGTEEDFKKIMETIGEECAEFKSTGNWFTVYAQKPAA